MAIRFYKKPEPQNLPVTSSNHRLDFKTIDHVWAYYAIDNQGISSEIERLMSEGRYSISEITAEEFTRDYVEPKKKLNGGQLPKPWRDEIGGRKQRDTVTQPVQKRNAAVDNPAPAPAQQPPPPPVSVAEPLPQTPAASVSDFKPPTANRSKLRKKK